MPADLQLEIKTKKDAMALSDEIEALKQGLYGKNERNFEELLRQSVRASTAKLVRGAIEQAGGDAEKGLRSVLERIKAADELGLILASAPTEKLVESMWRFVAGSVSGDVVLDLKIDKSLIGGAVVEYLGRRGDFSIKKKLNL